MDSLVRVMSEKIIISVHPSWFLHPAEFERLQNLGDHLRVSFMSIKEFYTLIVYQTIIGTTYNLFQDINVPVFTMSYHNTETREVQNMLFLRKTCKECFYCQESEFHRCLFRKNVCIWSARNFVPSRDFQERWNVFFPRLLQRIHSGQFNGIIDVVDRSEIRYLPEFKYYWGHRVLRYVKLFIHRLRMKMVHRELDMIGVCPDPIPPWFPDGGPCYLEGREHYMSGFKRT